jgi:ABC-type polysaccharide/polyol phosphate export permease
VQSSPLRNDGYTVIGGQRETIFDSLKEIWRYRALIFELVRRDLKMRYKGRVGGILWSLFPPLLQVLTITLMVKFFLTQVSNYSAYLMAVMFLWQFFANTVLDSSQSLLTNSQLVRKIYFPRAILPLVTLTSNIIHFSISFVFTLLYFFVVPVSDPIYPQNLRWEILWAFPCVLCVGMLALGIGYLLSYITTFYEDIRFLSGTFLNLSMYAVPILYPIEKVFAQANIYPFYMMNPMASLLVGFQRSLLPPIIDEKAVIEIKPLPFYDLLPWILVSFVTSTLVLALGFWMFERSKWSIMERL